MIMKMLALVLSLWILESTGIWVTGFVLATSASPPQEATRHSREEFEAVYAKQVKNLKEEILAALPSLNEQRKSRYLSCCELEIAAKSAVDLAHKRLGEIGKARALVDHAKEKWIGGAENEIAVVKAILLRELSAAERTAAEAELAKWEANKADGYRALEERQAALGKAESEQAAVQQSLMTAEKALAEATTQRVVAIRGLGLESLLSSDKLDAKLAKFVVLLEATPRGLAEFAARGEAQQMLIDRMLSDEKLLLQMALADGAQQGKYGRAVEIYQNIQLDSDKFHEGTLQRLALAIALEHAVPISQRNAVSATDAPAQVDPVKRYLHFERAFLDGELDPCFKDLSVWEYRMVVNGEEPDEILAWGREMLRNYRPDQITMPDYRWRYVKSVQTDVRYGSQDNQFDRDDLQFFQNIMMNGGVCGRRAFFGRFILRAFGVPTTARPQKGHAALVHWTPEGWVVCLGANWGNGHTKTRYKNDLEFLAHTQARATGEPFLQVKRAQWIGDVMGERRVFGFHSDSPEFWYGVALNTQQDIIESGRAKTLAAVGEDIAEANESKKKEGFEKILLTEADRKILVSPEGVLTIPASATTQPTFSTGKIIFMDSILGGKQLHYSRNGEPEDFVYMFDVPRAGPYRLTARVVTPSWRQSLQMTVNDAKELVNIALPFTVGRWESTEPVVIKLKKGSNVLRFSREREIKGCTIKDFTLTPIESGS